MRILLLPLFLTVAGAFAGCSTTGACCDSASAPQTVVSNVAKANPAVTRLTVHCAEKGALTACASTAPDKVGKPSDPEDKKVMETGKEVVLEEAGALDVSLPILAKDGKCTAVCGVTLKTEGMSRDQAIAKAREIAKAVEAGLGESCGDCCDDETEEAAGGCCSEKGDKAAAGGACCCAKK
jgi:hypothetical protein